jgi:hypothetical protein
VREIGVGDPPLVPPLTALAHVAIVIVAEQAHHRRVPVAALHQRPGDHTGRPVTVDTDVRLGHQVPGRRTRRSGVAGQPFLQHRRNARRSLAVPGAAQPLAVVGEEPSVGVEVPGVEMAAVRQVELADLLGVLEPPQPPLDTVA